VFPPYKARLREITDLPPDSAPTYGYKCRHTVNSFSHTSTGATWYVDCWARCHTLGPYVRRLPSVGDTFIACLTSRPLSLSPTVSSDRQLSIGRRFLWDVLTLLRLLPGFPPPLFLFYFIFVHFRRFDTAVCSGFFLVRLCFRTQYSTTTVRRLLVALRRRRLGRHYSPASGQRRGMNASPASDCLQQQPSQTSPRGMSRPSRSHNDHHHSHPTVACTFGLIAQLTSSTRGSPAAGVRTKERTLPVVV
jgi:hypothetical protein